MGPVSAPRATDRERSPVHGRAVGHETGDLGPPRAGGRPRRLAEPRRARVRAAPDGQPESIDGRAVEAVRESWLVEDRWWTDAPLRRRYWEVVTADGRNLVVFRDLVAKRWFTQR
jgi:hypothetical protein